MLLNKIPLLKKTIDVLTDDLSKKNSLLEDRVVKLEKSLLSLQEENIKLNTQIESLQKSASNTNSELAVISSAVKDFYFILQNVLFNDPIIMEYLNSKKNKIDYH